MDRHWIIAAAGLTALIAFGPPASRAQDGPYDPVEPGAEDSIIATFEAERTGPSEFLFRWTMEEDDRDEVLVCQLNFDGDEVVEASIENCADDRSASFTYDEPGGYRAVLTARSRDGGADTAHVRVTARD